MMTPWRILGRPTTRRNSPLRRNLFRAARLVRRVDEEVAGDVDEADIEEAEREENIDTPCLKEGAPDSAPRDRATGDRDES